jgi:sigma-E factor negative regulatory protein RseC
MSISCSEIAVVTQVNPGGDVVVKVRRAEACHSCSSKGACSALGGKMEDLVLVVENNVGARLGDQVMLSMSESKVILASVVLYLVPALSLVLGAMIGWKLAPMWAMEADPASILGCAVGLGLGLVLTKIIGSRMSSGSKYKPRLTGIVSKSQ